VTIRANAAPASCSDYEPNSSPPVHAGGFFFVQKKQPQHDPGPRFAAVVATMPMADQQAITAMVREMTQERNQ
jgi:hypothetical protein